MNLFLVIFTIFIILLSGFLFIKTFNFFDNSPLIEKLSFSWGLGAGLISAQLFLYSLIGIQWNKSSITLPWLILGVIFLINTHKLTIPKVPTINLNNFYKIFLIMLLSLIIFVGIESVIRPAQAWDAFSNWVFRPKVFFINNNLDLDYVQYTRDDYPLILPLIGTYGYITMGEVDDKYILLLFYMFYLAIGGIFFSFCIKNFNIQTGILFTFLLLSIQNILRHGGRYEAGQADLALGYFILTTSVVTYYFIKFKDNKYLILALIFAGLTAQIKNDGMPFFLIINLVIFFFITRWKKIKLYKYMLISPIIIGPWLIYKALNNYPVNFLLTDGLNIQLDRSLIVFLSMSKEFFNLQNWNLLWIILLFTIIIYIKNLKLTKILILILTLQWLSYFLIFLMTPREPQGHIENVINRLYLHIAPLAMLIIAIIIYDIPIIKKYLSK